MSHTYQLTDRAGFPYSHTVPTAEKAMRDAYQAFTSAKLHADKVACRVRLGLASLSALDLARDAENDAWEIYEAAENDFLA